MCIRDRYSLLHKLIQMGAAGVAVAKGALHHDLGLCKVIHLPAHADLQRIVFRCQFTHCLRTQLDVYKRQILTHRMITEAIARHDSIGARSAMVMHLNFNRNCIRKLYDGEWET